MRDIKLRFWDKENNYMVYQDKNGLYPNSFYKIICDCFTNFEFRLFKLRKLNQFKKELNQFEEVDSIKMQYTGLEDRNGIKIYEGDIIKTCEGRKQVVVWKDNGFKLKFTFSKTYQGEKYKETVYLELGDTSSKRWGDEVIGNIYEYPQLLQEENE